MKMILRLFILLLVLSAALGVGLAVFSCHIRRQTLEQAMAWQAAHYDISWYDSMEKTDYTVKSYDSYELHVSTFISVITSSFMTFAGTGKTNRPSARIPRGRAGISWHCWKIPAQDTRMCVYSESMGSHSGRELPSPV